MPDFYTQAEDEWGFAYVSGAWRQLAAVPPPVPGTTDESWISALTCDQSNPDKVYAVWKSDTYVRISTDAGVTWGTSRAFPSTPDDSSFPGPLVYSVQARSGQVFLFNNETRDAEHGIWRSTDDGATWTQLTTVAGPGFLSLASSKLWYATFGTTNVDFTRSNLDGTGVEVLANVAYSGYGGRYLVRALNDDLCLFTSRAAAQVYLVQSSGLSAIGPASFVPWDAVPLSATTFVAVGTASLSSHDVLMYRTTNAGSSWTLVQTIDVLEGFALNGSPDAYHHIDAAPPSRTDLVMTGNADGNVQQIFWISSDAGLTWTQILNEAEVFEGIWPLSNPGGVVARAGTPHVAIPSRLATIVG